MGGYAATATLLGAPDASLLSLTELADHCARLVDASGLPMLADGDTGFGNSTNSARTMRAFERAGVAALFIEDQVFPKRCGHTAGKDVIPAGAMVEKLKAMLDARVDPDLVIMARTDSLDIHGLDDAIERVNLYREVGADLVFVEALRTPEQMRRVTTEVDAPCLATRMNGGLTPFLPTSELAALGFAAVALPAVVTYGVAKAVERLLDALKADGSLAGHEDLLVGFEEFNELIGLPELRGREQHCIDFARDMVAGRGS
jgi:methylisocitrate lyase